MPSNFRGIVELESLDSPGMLEYLDGVRLVGARSEHHPEADTKYWTVCTVDVRADRIKPVAERIAQETKEGWYSMFWNPEEKYVVFRNTVFQLPREERDAPDRYAEARAAGSAMGVQEQYLDFSVPSR